MKKLYKAVLIFPRKSSDEFSSPENINTFTGTVEEADDRLLCLGGDQGLRSTDGDI